MVVYIHIDTQGMNVNEYPSMHYFRAPRHIQSMTAYMILSISGNSSEKSHFGNVVLFTLHLLYLFYLLFHSHPQAELNPFLLSHVRQQA